MSRSAHIRRPRDPRLRVCPYCFRETCCWRWRRLLRHCDCRAALPAGDRRRLPPGPDKET